MNCTCCFLSQRHHIELICSELGNQKYSKVQYNSTDFLFVLDKCFILSHALNIFHQNLGAAGLAQVYGKCLPYNLLWETYLLKSSRSGLFSAWLIFLHSNKLSHGSPKDLSFTSEFSVYNGLLDMVRGLQQSAPGRNKVPPLLVFLIDSLFALLSWDFSSGAVYSLTMACK